MTALEAGIVTDDVERLVHFYGVALQFAVESDRTFPQGRVCRLRRGDAGVKLYRPTSSTSTPVPRATDSPWHDRRGFAYAALLVDDLDSVVGAAMSAGATLITPVTAHRPGARFALVADPEGNVWELLEETHGAEGTS